MATATAMATAMATERCRRLKAQIVRGRAVTSSMRLQEEKGSSFEFLRRRHKAANWWEEDVELEVSSNWLC
ncbi:unnamed protein product [Cochlearia groenlandica]